MKTDEEILNKHFFVPATKDQSTILKCMSEARQSAREELMREGAKGVELTDEERNYANNILTNGAGYVESKLLSRAAFYLAAKDEQHIAQMFDNMQYYMEYCQKNGYVTPQDWIAKHKHF